MYVDCVFNVWRIFTCAFNCTSTHMWHTVSMWSLSIQYSLLYYKCFMWIFYNVHEFISERHQYNIPFLNTVRRRICCWYLKEWKIQQQQQQQRNRIEYTCIADNFRKNDSFSLETFLFYRSCCHCHCPLIWDIHCLQLFRMNHSCFYYQLYFFLSFFDFHFYSSLSPHIHILYSSV